MRKIFTDDMVSQLFQHASLCCLFVFIHNVDSLGPKSCTDSNECNQPFDEEFCDKALEACMPCAPYCTGSLEKQRNCADYCPKRYTTVYGRDKQPNVPDQEVLPLKEDPTSAEEGNTTNDDGSSGVVAVVVVPVIFVILIAVVAVRCYQLRPKGGYKRGDFDVENLEASPDEQNNAPNQADPVPSELTECVTSVSS